MKRGLPEPDSPNSHCTSPQQVYFQQPKRAERAQAQDSESRQHSASLPATSRSATMRLGGHLSGRVAVRSKARGREGPASDSELHPAVLSQQSTDLSVAVKGILTRKQGLPLPGQPTRPAGIVTSTRLLAHSNAPATASAILSTTSAPRHQRSHSAGHIPKGSLELQSNLANDLASIADAFIKACADPTPQSEVTEQQSIDPPASTFRRSARLAALAAAGRHDSKGLSRASAPARPAKHTTDVPCAAAVKAQGTTTTPSAPGTRDQSSTWLAPHPCANPPVPSAPPVPTAGRRVQFAAGPLDPSLHHNCSSDGHPTSEGAHAVPVRRLPTTYGNDLSRGNVLMLEQLLGPESSMSVARLKRRVGLLPPLRPPRTHANSTPAQG